MKKRFLIPLGTLAATAGASMLFYYAHQKQVPNPAVPVAVSTVSTVSAASSEPAKDSPSASAAPSPSSTTAPTSTPKLPAADIETPLYPVPFMTEQGRKWGYADETGRTAIAPAYDYAYDFGKNGTAKVMLQNKYGAIDRTGKLIVEPDYEYPADIYAADGDLIVMHRNYDQSEAFDLNGRKRFDADVFIREYRNGIAVYDENNEKRRQVGLIDSQGNRITEPAYLWIADLEDGFFLARRPVSGFDLIDRTGRTTKSFDYYEMTKLGNGLIGFQPAKGEKWGIINTDGTVRMAAEWDSLRDAGDGYVIVGKQKESGIKLGAAKPGGEPFIAPEYDSILYLSENRFAAGNRDPAADELDMVSNRYAIWSAEGKRLTDFTYPFVATYQYGMLSVDDGKNVFLLDVNGSPVRSFPKLEGQGIVRIYEKLYKANVDNRIRLFDKAGLSVWQESHAYASGEILIKENKFKPFRDTILYYPSVEGIRDSALSSKVNLLIKDVFVGGWDKAADSGGVSTEVDFVPHFAGTDLLDIERTGYSFPGGAAHGMPIDDHHWISLKSGKAFTLKDLFKPDSDFVSELNRQIGLRIKEEKKDWYTFETVSKEQQFYLDAGALHIVFSPYEIASFADGFVEFSLPLADLEKWLDRGSEFWSLVP